jgi:hypothetical protein
MHSPTAHARCKHTCKLRAPYGVCTYACATRCMQTSLEITCCFCCGRSHVCRPAWPCCVACAGKRRRLDFNDPIQRELVRMVGGGSSSASHAQRVACAVRDSTGHDTVLARMGSSGARPSNTERDFHRHVRASSRLKPEWWHVHLPIKGNRCQTKMVWWPVCLPHVMFRAMHEASLLHKLVPPGCSCTEFWEQCSNEPWFSSHPVLAKAHVATTVPIRVHGDEGQSHRKRPLLVLNWSSCLQHGDSWDSRLLIAVIPTGKCIKAGRTNASAQALCRAVAFSLTCLLDGEEPESLPPWLRRTGVHKATVAGEMRAGLVGVKGDGKFFKEFFPSVRGYNSNRVCRLCEAHKVHRILLFTDPDGAWRDTVRTHEQYMREVARLGMWSHFYDCPGWHYLLLLEDMLHCMFLGNGQDAAGSAFDLLSEVGHWQGGSANARLHDAYLRLKEWCKAHGLRCTASESDFTPIAMVKDMFPHLGGKGADVKVTLGFLAAQLHNAASAQPGHWELVRAATCFYYMVRWIAILDREPMFMSAEAAAEYRDAGFAYLRLYNSLAHSCVQAGVRRWKVRPKCHVLAHIFLRTEFSRMNPRFWSCWSDEDYIGKVCKLARATHSGTVARRTLDRWLANLAVRWR